MLIYVFFFITVTKNYRLKLISYHLSDSFCYDAFDAGLILANVSNCHLQSHWVILDAKQQFPNLHLIHLHSLQILPPHKSLGTNLKKVLFLLKSTIFNTCFCLSIKQPKPHIIINHNQWNKLTKHLLR